jgi:polyferredoxin
MMAQQSALAVVSVLLTLASLLGSFFYIHLSQWLREILALKQKFDLSDDPSSNSGKRQRYECKVELKKLNSWPNYVVNIVVITFVMFVMGLALNMIKLAAADPLYDYVNLALWIFSGTFFVLVALLLGTGIVTARSLAKDVG